MFVTQMIPHRSMRIKAPVILSPLAETFEAIPNMSVIVSYADRMGPSYPSEAMGAS